MSEQYFINRFFNPTINTPYVTLGPGDDAALVKLPSDHEMACSIDTLVAGVNFPHNTSPEDIAYKSIAVSLSDMAAMGAEPQTALVSLTIPKTDEQWLSAFSKGLFDILDIYQTTLIGGDMTKGPLSVTTIVNGILPTGQALYRSGADVDDKIYVTGTLGDAGLGLEKNPDPDCLLKLNRPIPRVEVGIALRKIASSAIDISDGLAIDLKKLCEASKVGAKVNINQLPINKASIETALTAGDDFELCFTIPPKKQPSLETALEKMHCHYQQIGVITAKKTLQFIQEDGNVMELKNEGYDHFT